MLVNILVAWGIWVMNGPLMEFTSRTEGRNAKVAIYEDRIEWGRSGWHPPGGATAAVLTAGMSLALNIPRATMMPATMAIRLMIT